MILHDEGRRGGQAKVILYEKGGGRVDKKKISSFNGCKMLNFLYIIFHLDT